MNPPASAPANAFFLEGLGTIRWGTDGYMKDSGLTTAIVDDVDDASEVDKIQIENNAGYRAVRILLLQGRQIAFTVVDDSARQWPGVGSKMMYQGPDDVAPIALLVLDPKYKAAKKKEGMRTITAEYSTAYTVV